MLNSVSVSGVSGVGTLILRLVDDPANGLFLKNIDGLNPVRAELATSEYARYDGQYYHGSRLGMRNIVFTIALRPDFSTSSVKDLRDLLYKYFTPGGPKLNFTFHTDGSFPNYHISGYAEAFETSLFSADPEVQISVICPDPEFLGPNKSVNLSLNTETTIDYQGHRIGGLFFSIANGQQIASNGFSIEHTRPDYTRDTIHYQGRLEGFSIIHFTSKVRQKEVLYSSGGMIGVIDDPRLYEIPIDDVWPLFYPGVNRFRVSGPSTGAKIVLNYREAFGGL